MTIPGLSILARWLTGAVLCTLACTASALNPATALPDYNHALWTAKDGAPPEIRSMAQTSDGMLWMASPSGLYRFDGVRFERYQLPRSDSPSRRRVGFVRAHPDGGLWISYTMGGGLSLLRPNGELEDVAPTGKLATVLQMAFDSNGDIWTVGLDGAHRIRQGKLERLDVSHGLPKEMQDVRIDRYGRLWMLSATAAFLYDRSGGKFTQVRVLPMRSSLIESPDGRIWIANYQRIEALPAPDAGARQLPPNPGNAPGFGSDWVAYFDREGNLWQLKCPNDLCVTPASVVAATNSIEAPPQAPAQLKPAPGVINLAGNAVLEDREHNIWIATLEGVDRYRDNRLQRIRLSSSRSTFTMAKGDDGQMWVCDPYNSAVWRLKAGAEPEREPQPAWLVVNDRDGALLLGWKRDIERRHKGQVEKIALPEIPGPDGKPQDLTLMGLTDDGKRMWAVSMQTGLILRVNGQWAPRSRFKLPPNIVLGTPGVNSGETWLATGEGNIVLFDAEDKLTSYPAPMIGLATGLFAGEEIVASGDQGVAVLAGGAFQRLQAADPEVLLNVSGLAVSADGDRWLNGGKGLVHVRRDDWKASIANPALPLRYQLFGVPDGYVGKAALENRAPSARIDQAGNLWLASSGGILRLDTRAVPRNTLAPVPAVLELHAGQARHDGRAAQVLAPGSQNFDISYTAASLRQPESVRFQYRLEGEDSAWQDAGARRTAYYTNIAPGSYRFQVRAANEDGVWSAQPASLAFEIPPTVTQTLWFKAICVIAAAGALYLLYLYRLRIVTAQLEERMEVRLAERERIARTLHDTFLQSMQGVVLRLDAAVDALPDGDATRQTLAPVLHSARDSISEGRAQVHELRESAPDDIESGLHDIAHLLAASYPGIRFALGVTGNRQPLRADVAGELKEIGLEAVRNAYQHADASAIDVTLDYGQQQFTLTVRDDGNGGAAGPAAAAGHWGVIGMRERAGRIGATLKIAGVPAQGSSVTLTLPAGRAYAGSSLSWWRRLFG